MKTKEQKYKEGVERNLSSADYSKLGTWDRRRKRGIKLKEAKTILGIRAEDGTFDERVNQLIN